MGLRHQQPPTVRADALDVTRDIALIVLAILQRARFIAEHQCAEEYIADGVAGENQADKALRSAELGEPLQRPLRMNPAGEGRVGRRNRGCLRCLAPSLITRQRYIPSAIAGPAWRSIGVEQGARAGDVGGMPRLAAASSASTNVLRQSRSRIRSLSLITSL